MIVIEAYICQYSIEFVVILKRRIKEAIRDIKVVNMSNFFLGRLSAICPPKIPIRNNGIVPKNATRETKNGEFVISNTIQVETISCVHRDWYEIIFENHKILYFVFLNGSTRWPNEIFGKYNIILLI